jgi:predicted transcriptional regulator/transcriptional regulator with XRE-family HTH domain
MTMARKAMLGHRLRRLRRDQGLTQAQLAERLGISNSYLNLIENNQRALTVDLLLKLGQSFDLDLQSFAEDDGERLVGALQEAFGDPLFAAPKPGVPALRRQDLVDLAAAVPAAAEAVLTLYQAYRDGRETLRLLAETKGTPDAALGDPVARTPFDEIRDWLASHGHYFAEIEAEAETMWQTGGLDQGALYPGLVAFLDRELAIRVKLLPVETMGAIHRRYDRHGRRILLSEMLPPPSRSFQLAMQIALIQHRGLLDRLTGAVGFSTPEATRVARIALAGYFAGAVMMPYDRFWRAATALRYDLDVLQNRFEASFEQVALRLTTLQRPGARGVPFFVIRIDRAGNVSRRIGSANNAFARLGGGCPRWNVHDAFRTGARLITQIGELPDGSRYLTLSRTVTKPSQGFRSPGHVYAIALSCEVAHAAQLVYADGLDLASDGIAVPIGLHCRVCERVDCGQRAFPPMNHRLVVDETVRGTTSFTFEPAEP